MAVVVNYYGGGVGGNPMTDIQHYKIMENPDFSGVRSARPSQRHRHVLDFCPVPAVFHGKKAGVATTRVQQHSQEAQQHVVVN